MVSDMIMKELIECMQRLHIYTNPILYRHLSFRDDLCSIFSKELYLIKQVLVSLSDTGL